MQILRGRHIHVRELAVSPDSRFVAAGRDRGLNVWDLHNPDAKPTFLPGRSLAIQFLTDGRLFTAAHTGWRLHDLECGRAVSWLRANYDREVHTVSASPCGQFVFETDRGPVLNSWRLSEDGLGLHRELVWSRPTADYPVFAPDAGRYAVRVYDRYQGLIPRTPWVICRTADGEPIARLEVQGSFYDCGQFTPDGGRFLAVAKWDICEWDARAGGPGRLAIRQPNRRYFRGVAVHPDGKTLAGVTSDGVSLFDLASGGLLRTYDWKCSNMRSVAFTPDGTRCVVAEVGNNVLLFDVE